MSSIQILLIGIFLGWLLALLAGFAFAKWLTRDLSLDDEA